MARYRSINLRDVLAFARKKHAGQYRKDGTPYIYHPIRVCELVKNNKESRNSDLLMAGALLHDVLEDTYTSYQELVDNFGKEVASLVEEVTSAGYVPSIKGKGRYLAEKMQYMTSYALFIKLADRLDNITDLSGLSESKAEQMLDDTQYIVNFLKANRDLSESHVLMIDKLQTVINIRKEKNKK